jgi:hypothetical protein
MRRQLRDLYFLGFSLRRGILAAVGAIFFSALIEFFQSLLLPLADLKATDKNSKNHRLVEDYLV